MAFSTSADLHDLHLYREVFLDFDPIAVSNLNEKKFVSPGSCASSLLSEVKLRAIIENAHQMCKVGHFCLFILSCYSIFLIENEFLLRFWELLILCLVRKIFPTAVEQLSSPIWEQRNGQCIYC